MTIKHYTGSCHCKNVRYEVDLDLSKGTARCNCSICTKARAWFAFVNAGQLRMVAGEDSMAEYRWTPPGRPEPFLTYRFCKTCGVRIYATGDAEFLGGRFFALAVATLDDVDADELAAAPMKFIDGRHDRFDQAPEDTRLL
ncbi:MAG: GFA family protein [Proteobacteria bacterium]|nr:GFA family protein [Pseudomonadota bacterium]